MTRIEIAKADIEVVKAMCDHLVKAYEEFCNETWPETPRMVDSLMAVHNFHVMVILQLERDYLPKDTETRLFHRKVAFEVFKEALENKPEFDPPPPPSETQFTRRKPGRKKKRR